MIETSGEARAEAPTATDPDSTKDLPIISTAQNINQPETCGGRLPAVCETDPSRCGCVLRHQAGYQEVTP